MDSEAIIIRLKKVLDYYSLTSSTFADTIDVQRSSISHLMSGRNKPSLDFVMKVVDKYPEVDLYWLLNGKGAFPKSKKQIISTPPPQDLFAEEIQEQKIKAIEKVKISATSLFEQNEPKQNIVKEKINTPFSATSKKMVKVILLYDDGSFEEFNK